MKAKYDNFEMLSGHLLPDKASQGSLPLIMRRITQITENLIEE